MDWVIDKIVSLDEKHLSDPAGVNKTLRNVTARRHPSCSLRDPIATNNGIWLGEGNIRSDTPGARGQVDRNPKVISITQGSFRARAFCCAQVRSLSS